MYMKEPFVKLFCNRSFCVFFLCLVLYCFSACKDIGNTPLDNYIVVWESPSDTEQNAMPLGNGDIGLNVWVEKGGDLLFYVGKTDSWDENARLINLGRVRLEISPNPFGEGLPFQQELKLRQGKMVISAGAEDSQVHITLWVDANQPVARIEVSGKEDFDIQVSLETWRNEKHELQHLTHSDIYDHYLEPPSPFKMIVKPDVIAPELPRYGRMVETVFQRLGFTATDFVGYRLKIAYPPIPATALFRHVLPEKPADA